MVVRLVIDLLLLAGLESTGLPRTYCLAISVEPVVGFQMNVSTLCIRKSAVVLETFSLVPGLVIVWSAIVWLRFFFFFSIPGPT